MPHKDEINSYLAGMNLDYIEQAYAQYLIDPTSVDQSWIPFFGSLGKEDPSKKIIFSESLPTTFDTMDLYRTYGHFWAKLDPLKISKPKGHNAIEGNDPRYCGTLGYEFMHLEEQVEKDWFIQKIEKNKQTLAKDDQIETLESLFRAEMFEQYLHTKFQGAKRFSVEGGESLIPALRYLLKNFKKNSMNGAVIGMAHRGRLNVITNVLDLPFSTIFKKFMHHHKAKSDVGSGDVKYHMGATSTPSYLGGDFKVELASNPSHLESVNPVVLGEVRARQDKGEKVSCILVHGDASFMGQGVVAESLNLSKLEGYSTHGTIHVIVNNQVGFTAAPGETRSSTYCSDLMKMINAPIIHVNGDDVEAVLWACEIASEYHRTFQKDIAIDLVCYRKYGHNETDEPFFTQPLMYQAIAKQKSTANQYGEKFPEITDQVKAKITQNLQNEYNLTENMTLEDQSLILKEVDVVTGISQDAFKKILHAITFIPEGYTINPKIIRQLEAKKDESKIDWATGEALSFGSLLLQGKNVRLSGQDSMRGTFSHRHSVLTCQDTGKKYAPLKSLGNFNAINSSLSEFAVMGFEFGYAAHHLESLVMWEAQFGDFANGAQTIVDQYLSASESKWGELCGLVLLLPHGYEGQGPEHSSARFERYLQLCAQYNMQVVYPTTPANYFHVLRRQMMRTYQKPLIVITPKSLLRNKNAISSLEDFGPKTSFQKVISSGNSNEKIIFCTGKIYYDLMEAQIDAQIIRLEQLYPFPSDDIQKVLPKKLPEKILWVQEEPENMGAWNFVSSKFDFKIKYIGRSESASTATGDADVHAQEQKNIIEKAKSY
jgi:2-oxoglutarate dehydrogenase E1 component